MEDKLNNLNNLEYTNSELLKNYEVRVNDIQNDFLPSSYNFVLKELNSLRTLINDDDYLEASFQCFAFERTIFFSKEKGFYAIYDGFKKRLLDLKPSQLIGKFTFKSYSFANGERHYTFVKMLKNFVDYVEFFKNDYLNEINESDKIAKELNEILFNE